MKRFSKKTIALVLASVVTVVGAFGANNYKNCLKDLVFEGTQGGSVNMTLHTSTAYEGNLSLIRKDASTYVLTLPDVTSQVGTPDLSKVSNSITSVNVRTMPYSNNSNGYTRITVKTSQPALNLTASNKLYIETAKDKLLTTTQEKASNEDITKEVSQQKIKNINTVEQVKVKTSEENTNTKPKTSETTSVEKIDQTFKVKTATNNYTQKPTGIQSLYAFFWILLIVLCSCLFYTKAKTKITEISGEKLDLNIDESPKPEEKEIKKITKPSTIKTKPNPTYKNKPTNNTNVVKESKPQKIVLESPQKLNIVDLDALYKEQLNKTNISEKEEEENQALEDFLSGFSFNEYENIIEIHDDKSFDEDLLQQTLGNNELNFSNDDIIRINKLLELEINDDTLRNVDKYLVSSPIRKPTKQEVLENLVTTYAISQNILFSSSDIEILNKLISIELDNDFITDWRSKASKTEKEISEQNSEENSYTLEDYGSDPEFGSYFTQKAEAEIETKTGEYGASVLILDVDLPDLSVEINKKGAFAERPSARYEVVDTSYTVGDNIIKDVSDLPDISDAVRNPNKYMQQKEVFIASEETLLKNIENVTFKKFGEPEEPEDINASNTTNTEALNIQKELEDFTRTTVEPVKEKKPQPEIVTTDSVAEETMLSNTGATKTADILMTRLQKARITRQEIEKKQENQNKNINSYIEPVMTVFNGKSYAILNSVALNKNIGCHLAKNDNGYIIFGYIGDNVINIKQYEDLKSEKMQARLYETFEDNTLRYIIKIGVQKFVVDIKDNDIKFVMDL